MQKQILQLLKQHRLMFISILGVVCAFIVLFWPTAQKHSQSFKFVDEEEHITIAWLMSQDYVLYEDLTTNHQPLNYIASYAVQAISQPDNTFMMIKRHRDAIVIWSLIWSVMLILRFGPLILPGILAFESIKYLTLGNQFLAESLVAYPLLYLFLWSFFGDKFKLNWRSKSEYVFVGIVAVAAVFTSLPLAIPIALLMIWRLISDRFGGLIWLILGGFMMMGLVFSFVSPQDYFRETIYNNIEFAIPRLSRIESAFDWFKLILLPVVVFFSGKSYLTDWIMTMGLIWLGLLSALIYKKEYKKLLWWLGIFIVWGLANSRVLDPGRLFYGAFHLSPWLIVGLGLTGFMIRETWELLNYNKSRLIYALVIVVMFGLLIKSPYLSLKTDIDPAIEHYIQYTPLVQAAQVINSLQREDDNLLVIPTEALLYWQTSMLPINRQVTYYEWQYYPESNRSDFDLLVSDESSLPEFIFYYNDSSAFAREINPVIENHYKQVVPTGLGSVYILNSRADELTDSEKDSLNELTQFMEINPTLLMIN